MLFGLIPTIKFREDTVEIDGLDTRKQGDQINFDILRVATIDDDGDRLLTQFGIQGQSDHLAKVIRKRRLAGDKRADADFQREVDTNAVENNMPLQAVS